MFFLKIEGIWKKMEDFLVLNVIYFIWLKGFLVKNFLFDWVLKLKGMINECWCLF